MATAADILGVQNTPVDLAQNPEATATIPVQDSGQTVNVNSAPPSAVQPGADPATATIQQQPMDAYQDPEIRMAAAHHNWLANIMDKATDILAGDTSVHVTRDAQTGNVTVTHDPATSGEKWGRIASAVLGGAAKGYAAGQGPGGSARALATGFQTGQNIPQQQLAQANAEAANMSAQQLADANNALVHQKIVGAGLANREAGLTLGTQEASLLQSAADSIQNSPNTTDLGSFTDMPSIMKAVQDNPAILQGHTNQALKIIPTADAKGTVQLHAFLVDQGDDNRKNDKVEQAFKIEVDPKTGAPALGSDDIAPQSQKKGAIRLAQQATIAQYFDMKNAWDKNHKPETEKTPTTAQAALIAAGQETDPVKKQALLDSAAAIQKNELALKAAGRAPAAGGAVSTGGATGPDALAALPTGDAATVKAIGEGRQAPPSRFTKEGQRIMGMVNQVYPDYDSTQYPTYQKMRQFMTSGAGGVGLNFIGTARNHLDELERTIPDNVTVPLIGSAINWAKNTATRATNPDLRAFESARSAVSDEVAKAYKGGAISLGEHDQMQGLINESDSPGALRGSIGEFRRLLNGKLSSYQTQWASAMPRGAVSPNSALESLLGATPTPAPGGGAAPAAAPAAPAAAPAAPSANDLVTVQIPGQQPGHIPRSALAKFQHENPNAKVF